MGVAPSETLSGVITNIEKINGGIRISDAKGGEISVEIDTDHLYGSLRPFGL